MHAASNPHDPRFQNSCALFPIFMPAIPAARRDILPDMAAKNPNKKRKASLDVILSTVERGFAAVADDIADIKSKMATKDDIANLGGQLTSVERELTNKSLI
jgi:hypothetical protein